MLTSEFTQEMASLIRSLERKVMTEPVLTQRPAGSPDERLMPPEVRITLDHVERSIITLVALHIAIRRQTNG